MDTNQDINNYMKLFEQRFEVKENTLAILYSANVKLKETTPIDVKYYFNFAAFINILSYDIMLICRDLLSAKSTWEKKHYSRQSALIIYESINDLFELLGRKFKDATDKISDEDLHLEIREFRNKLNQFKTANFSKLQEIRNMSIAHREKDSLKQLNTIFTINEEYILKITLEFNLILNELQETLQIFFTLMTNKIEADEW